MEDNDLELTNTTVSADTKWAYSDKKEKENIGMQLYIHSIMNKKFVLRQKNL